MSGQALKGRAYAPASSKRYDATLLCNPDNSVSCFVADQVFILQPHELRSSPALGAIPRALALPGGWVFEVENAASLQRWLAKVAPESRLHRLEKSRIAVVMALVLLVVIGGWFLFDGVARSARVIATLLPASVEEYVGSKTLVLLDKQVFSESKLSQSEQQDIQLLFDRLAVEQGFAEKSLDLHFRSWGGQVNAFALANGSIIVTDSMVKLAENRAELASVLLHEMAHVVNNDVMAQLVQGAIFAVLSAYVIGDLSTLGDVLVGSAVFGLSMHHSREAELRADLYAAKAMQQYFGSREDMLNMFQRLQQEGEVLPEWLASHDSIATRIRNIEGLSDP